MSDKEFDAMSSAAIAASENEIFSDALDIADPVADETGDRSLEDMGGGLEGQHEHGEDDGEEADPTEAAAEAAPEGETAAERDARGRFQPPAGKIETPAERGLRTELVAERDKRKAIESEAAELKARFAAMEARLAQPAPQPQKAEPQVDPAKEEIPDRWTDPEGYERYREEQILQRVEAKIVAQDQRRLAGSFEDARAEHGPAFEEAYNAANSIPNDHPAAKQIHDILRSPNPGRAVMQWYKQQQAQREIGNDPVAFRERVATEARETLMKDPEFRKQILADLQAEARGNGAGPARTNLPPSLNSARGGSQVRGAGGGGTDSDIFAATMS